MYDYRFQSNTAELTTDISDVRTRDNKIVAPLPKPRILMVGMHLTKTRGGITTLISEILKSPLKDDFDLTYIESQAEDFGTAGKIGLALKAIFKFIWTCLSKSPALVYVHLGSNASLYRESVFIILAKLMRRKVIAHFHAGDIDIYFPKQSRLGQSFIRRAFAACNDFIAVSQESARQLRKFAGSANISVIPNAIDTSVFLDHDSKLSRKNDADPVNLLFVGAMGKLKGEMDLVQALAILKNSGDQVKATFLGYGSGDLGIHCEAMGVAGLIEYMGAIPMDERIKYFNSADIFVLPTYAEAMPMSVIEAMAAGLPTVTTTVGGIPELINDGEDGLLVQPGDIDALAKEISFLVNNDQARHEMGRRAQEKVRKNMDIAEYSNRLKNYLFLRCSA